MKESLYNFLMEFSIPMKLERLIKSSVFETCCRVRVGKNVYDIFHIMNGLKQGDGLSKLLFNFTLEYTIRRVQVYQNGLKLKVPIRFWFMLMILIYWAEAYLIRRKTRYLW